MIRISTLFLIFLFSIGTFAQKQPHNALMFPKLIISDIVPIDSVYFDGFGFARSFYTKAYYKVQLKEELNALLVKKITEPQVAIYENYSPYEDVYFEKYNEIFTRIPIERIKKTLGEYTDTIFITGVDGELEKQVIIHTPDTSEIKGLLFLDEWNFDEKEFKLTKQVLAYCPVRRYTRDGYEEDSWLYRKIGYFVFPELKRRKLRKIEKKMHYIGRIEYEYPIENRYLFDKSENEMALFTEDYDSPYWNSYARLKFRNLIIERALSAKSKVYDFHTKKEVPTNKIKERLGYKMEEITLVDPETNKEKKMEYETEIIREDIKSVIFIEDWWMDNESMRLKKEIIGVAPVRYCYGDDYETKLKKVAFILYFDENKR